MKTHLDFEQNETKKLLSKLNFKFYLDQNIRVEDYAQEDLNVIYTTFELITKEVNNRSKENKRQFNYFIEGKIRKMFTGGFLPAHFELDESRTLIIVDFHAVGESWAYFNYWQKYYKSKVNKEKLSNAIIKTGSILAILLSVLKLIEFFKS